MNRKIFLYGQWTLLILLALVALLNVAGRMLLANVDYFREEMEQQFADYGIRGVSLDNLSAQWDGFQPVLLVEGGSLSIPGRDRALSASRLELRVQLVSTLLRGELVLESFYGNIEKLILVRDQSAVWWLNDLQLTTHGSVNSALDLFVLFQRLPGFVDIDIEQLQLRDLLHAKEYRISGSHLRSSRSERALSLQLQAQLPPTLGGRFDLSMTGDDARQQIYVEASNLQMPRLLQLLLPGKLSLAAGQLDLRSWIQFDRFKVSDIINDAQVSGLALQTPARPSEIFDFSWLQSVERVSDGWQSRNRIDHIQKGGQSLPALDFQLQTVTGSPQLRLSSRQISLANLRQMLHGLKTEQSWLRRLTDSDASGQLSDILAVIDLQQPERSMLSADFTDLAISRQGEWPGINQLDGRLLYADGLSRLDLRSQNLELDFGDWFRAPLPLGQVEARVALRQLPGRQIVQVENLSMASSATRLNARLWMEKEPGQRPYVFIRSHNQSGKVTDVPKFLPVRIMPGEVVGWLDRALLGGTIREADFVFHGRLRKPSQLAEASAGLMHSAVKVDQLQLKFLPDWPHIGGGQGEIDFINAGLSGRYRGAKFAGSEIAQLAVSIEDFHQAGLRLQAQTSTSARVLLESLQQLPPLQQPVSRFTREAEPAGGRVNSDIDLVIPLSSHYPHALNVSARARLVDVSVKVPQWMLNLEQLNGVVDFENVQVKAKDLEGLYYGDKVAIQIEPQPEQRTLFTMAGNIQASHLLGLTPDYLRQSVAGRSDWIASVSLAHHPSVDQPLLKITAESGIQGTQLNFPQPLFKSKNLKRPVQFNARLSDSKKFYFKLRAEHLIGLYGMLDLASEQHAVLGFLNISLGNGGLPATTQGIAISGSIDTLKSSHWIDFIRRYSGSGPNRGEPFLQQLQSVDVDIDQLYLGNQLAQQVRLSLDNDGSELLGTVDSTLTRGQLTIPYQLSVLNPLTAELEYIRLNKPTDQDAEPKDTSQKEELDITSMPNLFIRSDAISYGEMEVSNLVLSTRNEGDSFVIEQLDFSRDQVRWRSSGHWQFDRRSGEHVSVFNIAIQGNNFGKVVNNLGLGETIQGGTIDFNGQIGWAGALFNINWPSLIGEVSLSLKDGYLKNVDPGAGRFVGLLSFSALPKRLFLDFGDVVKDGMQFDRIEGHFTIKGETMFTEDALLDSVSARVDIQGETNLRRKTYDQTMTITPKIGDTLPVLGALTAGNAVGWGLLLLQKIFKKPIDKSVQIEYKVSGSWDDPKIDLVAEKKLKTKDEKDEKFDFGGGDA